MYIFNVVNNTLLSSIKNIIILRASFHWKKKEAGREFKWIDPEFMFA